MSNAKQSNELIEQLATTERSFIRFTLGQRWEHVIVIISFTILLFTGLPQKYRTTTWSQTILSTPERVEMIRQIHHIAAVVLIAEVIYHLGFALYLLFKRKLSGEMFPTWQDFKDAWQMIKYLLFLSKRKPAFGKYNFEQKFTYWFIFFGIGIMVITGLILWFPIFFTQFLPGGIIPAAKLAHSSEAIVAVIFIITWHVYHNHLERQNLSIFTGRLNEKEYRKFHPLEYQRITGEKPEPNEAGGR